MCVGYLTTDGPGSHVRLQDATFAPGDRALLLSFVGVGAVIAMIIAIAAWRRGNTTAVWGAMGFCAFAAMVCALLWFSTTGKAADEARDFVRRALEGARTADHHQWRRDAML